MELDPVQAAIKQVTNNNALRKMDAQFGEDLGSGRESDAETCILAMTGAYESLANGIHENAQAWDRGEEQLLQKVTTPTTWINGTAVGHITEFLYTPYSHEGTKQPDFVTGYHAVRDGVYEELLRHGIETDNYEPLLKTIVLFEEQVLARRLLRELRAKTQRNPDMIAGDAALILGRISMNNSRVRNIHSSSERFALKFANQQRESELRKQLHEDSTGMMKAISIGIKIKYGGFRSAHKWKQVVFDETLQKIARLPTVPEQLIKIERQGLSPN